MGSQVALCFQQRVYYTTLEHSPPCVPSLPAPWQMICTCGNGTSTRIPPPSPPPALGRCLRPVFDERKGHGVCFAWFADPPAILSPTLRSCRRWRRRVGNDKRTGGVRKSTRAKSVAYETRRRREEALLLAEQNPREGGAVSLLPSVRREGRRLLFWSEREVARRSRGGGEGGLERGGASSTVCSQVRVVAAWRLC